MKSFHDLPKRFDHISSGFAADFLKAYRIISGFGLPKKQRRQPVASSMGEMRAPHVMEIPFFTGS
jgi:hypothetical protein